MNWKTSPLPPSSFARMYKEENDLCSDPNHSKAFKLAKATQAPLLLAVSGLASNCSASHLLASQNPSESNQAAPRPPAVSSNFHTVALAICAHCLCILSNVASTLLIQECKEVVEAND